MNKVARFGAAIGQVELQALNNGCSHHLSRPQCGPPNTPDRLPPDSDQRAGECLYAEVCRYPDRSFHLSEQPVQPDQARICVPALDKFVDTSQYTAIST